VVDAEVESNLTTKEHGSKKTSAVKLVTFNGIRHGRFSAGFGGFTVSDDSDRAVRATH
jgi:hypothetical protein